MLNNLTEKLRLLRFELNKHFATQTLKVFGSARLFGIGRWIVLVGFSVLLLWNYSELNKRLQNAEDYDRVNTVDLMEINYTNYSDIFPVDYRFSHPFENSCSFPTLNIEDQSISREVKHRQGFKCEPSEFEQFVSQSRDGELVVGRPFKGLINNSFVDCFYRELTGALWPKIDVYEFKGPWKKLPLNRHLTLDKSQFAVKCWHKKNSTVGLVYHNAFANILSKRDLNPPTVDDRVSIAILQIDSTSRNQFYRHMPRTLQFMRQNEFQILRGYTKSGDNSAINTLALLAGMGFETKYRGLDSFLKPGQFLNENQTRDDILKYVDMVFNRMKRDGCATLWNDDIGKAEGGLFSYQAFNGFRRPPADHYFRPYYTYLYRNLNAQSVCVNGEFVIPKWLNLWERFSTMHADRCHFSFNHISFFTHANGNNLELYDWPLLDALTRMKTAGVLNNTVLLISGDHGQRIHPIKHTYYGKIEERMPLAAIYIPQKLRNWRPEWFRKLIKNTNRFTSTFDLHETLRDLSELKVGTQAESRSARERVGRSLFSEIPIRRDCKDAKVPLNFCVCMEPLNDLQNTELIQATATKIINAHLTTKLNDSCILAWQMQMPISWHRVYAVTPLVRYGPRYLEEWERRLKANPNGADILREIVEIEYRIPFTVLRSVESTKTFNRHTTTLRLLIDPWLANAPCSVYRLDELCSCFVDFRRLI
ncbi:hypothetical protein M3Y98_00119500 [Aphelenchoides besseyi]|nr:hypothetical protein M3Y98_00119500 [Aphelenchoides besseyi]